jgi:hypothetical protein
MKKLPGIRALWQALRGHRHANPTGSEYVDGEMPLIDEGITDTGYYNEISFRYHSVQIICIMLLAVFLAVTLMTNAHVLSADNFIYFVKDMATTVADKEKEAKDTFVYASDEDNQYALYREGLVVLGKQKLTVFTATGREAHSHLLSYQNPRLSSSGRYLAAYDMGGRSVSLYNSFTCVKEITSDHAVRTMAICNKGYYCLITDSAEYPSEVVLYNDRHRMINRYRLEEYTVCADLKPDGSELMLASVSADMGRMVTHIAFATPGKTEWGHSFEVMDAYPVACQYTDEGNIRLLSTDAIYLFNAAGEQLSCYRFSASQVLSFRMNADSCVMICRDDTSDYLTRVLVFDKWGNLEYNISVSGAARDACYADGALAVLCQGQLLLYRGPTEDMPATVTLKGDYRTIMSYNNQEFLLCGDAKTVTVQP